MLSQTFHIEHWIYECTFEGLTDEDIQPTKKVVSNNICYLAPVPFKLWAVQKLLSWSNILWTFFVPVLIFPPAFQLYICPKQYFTQVIGFLLQVLFYLCKEWQLENYVVAVWIKSWRYWKHQQQKRLYLRFGQTHIFGPICFEKL